MFPGRLNLEGYLRALADSEMWKSYETTDDRGVMARTKMVQEAVDVAYDYGKNDFEQAHPVCENALRRKYEAQAAHIQRQ